MGAFELPGFLPHERSLLLDALGDLRVKVVDEVATSCRFDGEDGVLLRRAEETRIVLARPRAFSKGRATMDSTDRRPLLRAASFLDGEAWRRSRLIVRNALSGPLHEAPPIRTTSVEGAAHVAFQAVSASLFGTLAPEALDALDHAVDRAEAQTPDAVEELRRVVAEVAGGAEGGPLTRLRRSVGPDAAVEELAGLLIASRGSLEQLYDSAAPYLEKRLYSEADLGRLLWELLRFHPPAEFVTRRAQHDLSLGGRPIASGTLVVMDLMAVNRAAHDWSSGERFLPERWSDEEFMPNLLPRCHAWLPFGHGPRKCPAARFSMKIALELLRRRTVGAQHSDGGSR